MRSDHDSSVLEALVLEEVLPRLPVHSLTRLKRVSKKWLNHITNDSLLVANHLRRHSHTAKLSLTLAYREIGPKRIYTALFLDHSDNEPSKVEQVIDISPIATVAGEFQRAKVLGSCDGLVCLGLDLLTNNQRTLLWNPQTGEARINVALTGDLVAESLYGFGFDRESNDYKLIRVAGTVGTKFTIEVLAMKEGFWRRVEEKDHALGHEFCADSFESGVFVDGRFYWPVIAFDGDDTVRHCIMSFDLCDEELRFVDVKYPARFDAFERFGFENWLVKWRENCLGCLTFVPVDVVTDEKYKEVGFQLIVLGSDNNGDINVGDFVTLSLSRWYHRPLFRGVSRDRFLVEEVRVRTGDNSLIIDASLVYHV